MSSKFEDFFNSRIYDEFDSSLYDLDLEGWNSTHPIFHRLIEQYEPSLIIEVGTWKGASAIHMADIIDSLKLHSKVICIDTFLGWPEADLKKKYGFPKLYEQFLSNIIKTNHTHNIIPFPQTSELSAIWLISQNIQAEIVYIDASHYFSAVYDDMVRFWPIVKKEGCLFGDDYNRDGVKQAVDLFVDLHGLTCKVIDEKWIITKDKDIKIIDAHEHLLNYVTNKNKEDK